MSEIQDLQKLLDDLKDLKKIADKINGRPTKEERDEMPRFGVRKDSDGEKRFFINAKNYEACFQGLEDMYRRIEFLKFFLAERLPSKIYALSLTKGLIGLVLWLEVMAAKAIELDEMVNNNKIKEETREEAQRLLNIYKNDAPAMLQKLMDNSFSEIDEIIVAAKKFHEKHNE